MIDLEKAQRELYQQMKDWGASSFFLRKSRCSSFLWVSDVLLRNPVFPYEALKNKGYSVEPWQDLLGIGFSEEMWWKLLNGSSEKPLKYPHDDEWLEVYSLARLFLLHPSQKGMNISVMNQAYQLTTMKAAERNRATRKLLAANAVLLREGKGLCEQAGRMLCCFLADKLEAADSKEGNQ